MKAKLFGITTNKMKKALEIIAEVLLWVWQAPQNIVGLVFGAFIKDQHEVHTSSRGTMIVFVPDDIRVARSNYMQGGISLGMYVYIRTSSVENIRHELGHCVQSRYLGPLYLLVVGIASLAHAIWWTPENGKYEDFFTERWAERLGERFVTNHVNIK